MPDATSGAAVYSAAFRRDPAMRLLLLLPLLLPLIVFSAGCGQRGALYLPEEAPAETVPETAPPGAVDTADEDFVDEDFADEDFGEPAEDDEEQDDSPEP